MPWLSCIRGSSLRSYQTVPVALLNNDLSACQLTTLQATSMVCPHITLPLQASRSILTECPADQTCVALVDLAIRPHPSADNPNVNINDVAVAVAGAVKTFNFQVGWLAGPCLLASGLPGSHCGICTVHGCSSQLD